MYEDHKKARWIKKRVNKEDYHKAVKIRRQSRGIFLRLGLTVYQTPLLGMFKGTQIFLIPSLIKITYMKECVRLHQGFHLLYNEVNAETQSLPQQCKWRPNDNLHYLNKVIAITLRYSNEDRCFEPSALNSLLLFQNIWMRRRTADFGIFQGFRPLIQCDVNRGQRETEVLLKIFIYTVPPPLLHQNWLIVARLAFIGIDLCITEQKSI